MKASIPSAIILYHFFYPDDVVSARHFSDFAEALVFRGWKVTVLTSNRYCRHPKGKIPEKEEYWRGVRVIRVGRLGLDQANNIFRMVNAFWMMLGWLLKLWTLAKADVIIIGSDPQFSQLIFPFTKLLAHKSILVYWCYDLFPDAVLANGAKGLVRWVANRSKYFIKKAYRSVDLLVDIGQCMRKRLEVYHPHACYATLTPWALVEPESLQEPDPAIRCDLFGDARLALLYSGNIGKAHDFELFIQLARSVYKKDSKITFCFACRGNRFEELKKAIIPQDYNIRLAPFAEESELEKRLNAADIHLLSLRPEWAGIVVPSKFFGSLAVGKPVIYAGPENSSISYWIREFNVGLVLTQNNIEQIGEKLVEISRNPNVMKTWQKNAIDLYDAYFSKKRVMDKWNIILRNLISHNALQHQNGQHL
jgi:glycosyltransferase involved in cell wall biosynthesis